MIQLKGDSRKSNDLAFASDRKILIGAFIVWGLGAVVSVTMGLGFIAAAVWIVKSIWSA